MKSTGKTIGVRGRLLSVMLLAAPAAPAAAQQSQDSSQFSPPGTDATGYSDSLVRPGYRALLEDTTVGFAGETYGNPNGLGLSADTASQKAVGSDGGADTTAIPGRREEE